MVAEALNQQFPDGMPFIRGMFDETVVYDVVEDERIVIYERSYVIDENGKVTFGEAVEVKLPEVIEPVAESAQLETAMVPLVEAGALSDDGKVLVKIIQPGWNTEGEYFYPADVLERDIPQIFPAGTHMYWNHQTDSEEAERPEGDLNDLAAVLESTPEWRTEPAGPGMYAVAEVFEHYRPFVDELAEHIGSSIRAFGLVKPGEAEGHKGLIVEQMTGGKSVDYVTHPGAGGKVLSLFEAAGRKPYEALKESKAHEPEPEEEQMDKKELNEAVSQAVTEAVKPLQEEVDKLKVDKEALKESNERLVEAGRTNQATDLALKSMRHAGIPETAKHRIASKVALDPPLTEAGGIDTDKFSEAVKQAVTDEAEYLRSSGVVLPGTVTGMGDDFDPLAEAAPAKPEELVERQKRAWKEMGMDDKQVDVAAKGA